ncbi:MAG: hypothetical protein Q4C07_02565 [Eubacteriales bacterium]|nr:hypothetical protein [Eubacteriales bacterium]
MHCLTELNDKQMEVRKVNIVVNVEFVADNGVAAATYYKGGKVFNVLQGRLLPASKPIKLEPDSQIVVDYTDFIESVTDLITDYYNLKVCYKNKSENYSYYFGMLAKDSNNDIIMDFDFTLRISNHLPKRFKSSQEHKNKRKQDLKEFTGGRPTRPQTKSIIVNEKVFSNYMDAYEYTDKLVDRQCFLRRSF